MVITSIATVQAQCITYLLIDLEFAREVEQSAGHLFIAQTCVNTLLA
ncbi:hypothetical protein X564_11120 [Pseudoalteromonas agarivorans]|nr:hypothetical protein X564_11120 [Pseudoalteromonas agarivorans]